VYIRNNELNTRDVWQNIVGEKMICGARWIMRDSPNYAEVPRLCTKLCARI